MTAEPSPSNVGRWATDLDALRPGGAGFSLPVSIAPHLSLWRLIAEGSSLVYEGHDRRIGARVAVKLLAVRDDGNARARLMREAALYANLDNPSLPRLYDVASLSDGTPYVVMEFVAGQTVAELLGQGPLGPSLACDIANQILGSLAALHRAGIVHRDIKPTNIILEPGEDGRRRARLVDLGVAKATAFDSAPEKLTQTGALLGTPQYMAPEQFAGADADARTDLYAVGLLLVEMLTGSCPHASGSFADLIAARMRDEMDEATLMRAGVGPGLTDFIRTALARDPAVRFASAEDMQCELHAARADESCLWMQRPARRAESPQVVGAVASLPPPANVEPPRVRESAVWGVLPDPPRFEEMNRPPTRSGVKALLLGFGLTFGVGAVLVFRAQTRDAAELPPALTSTAPPSTAEQSPSNATDPSASASAAAPLAAPALVGGAGGAATASSAQSVEASESPLGSGSILSGIPALGARRSEESVAAQLARAVAERPTPDAATERPAAQAAARQPGSPLAHRSSGRRRAQAEQPGRYWEPPPRDSSPREDVDRPRSRGDLPDNPY